MSRPNYDLIKNAIKFPFWIMNGYLFLVSVLFFNVIWIGASYGYQQRTINVGVATVDITPDVPIRLAGYGDRDSLCQQAYMNLWAKALAIGSEKKGISILITMDLIGVPSYISDKLRQELAICCDLEAENVVICASHTHSGPQVLGNVSSNFRKPLELNEMVTVIEYRDTLVSKLTKLSLEAIDDIRPAIVTWGIGEVDFAVNRRTSINPVGVVDHSLPLLKVTDLEGHIRAILVSYACHAVTLGPGNNVFHGDWVGEAQIQIEKRIPGSVALVALGCGGDQNSSPRMNSIDPTADFEYARIQGKSIADEVDHVLQSGNLKPLADLSECALRVISLELNELSSTRDLVDGAGVPGPKRNYAHLALNRMMRGEDLPTDIPYPIQVWSFGDDLAMVFLAGEVVVDYSLRLKKEFNSSKLWVIAYANSMPAYIPSTRILLEGGYEAGGAMQSFELPAPFEKNTETKIIETVQKLIPKKFKN